MAKRKISKQQQRRIQQRQQQFREQADDSQRQDVGLVGTVISHHGKQVLIESETGLQVRCHLRTHIDKPVCGDKVIWQQESASEFGTIIALQPRQSEWDRYTKRGERKVVAANISQAFIVLAAKPEMQEGLIDRYLVALSHRHIDAVLVFNKVDLLDETQRQAYRQRLGPYLQLGYPLLETSVKQQHGLDPLLTALQGKTSVFIGQSGVGKSSLIQALLPDESIRIGKISDAHAKGRHTTTAARLYHLPSGGHIIDSPGIREISLEHFSLTELIQGFREFHAFSDHCQFRDCTHLTEPGCAILAAVERGDICRQRWESYRQLVEEMRASAP